MLGTSFFVDVVDDNRTEYSEEINLMFANGPFALMKLIHSFLVEGKKTVN